MKAAALRVGYLLQFLCSYLFCIHYIRLHEIYILTENMYNGVAEYLSLEERGGTSLQEKGCKLVHSKFQCILSLNHVSLICIVCI